MTMKKAFLVAASLVVISGSLSSASAGSRSREETAPYNWYTYSPAVSGEIRNFVTFDPARRERYIDVSIQDVSGMDVAGTVEQDRDGDGIAEVIDTFCSETDRRVPIRGGMTVVVGLELGPCSDGGLLLPISGEVRAVFTR
jgi:hypothetical protein